MSQYSGVEMRKAFRNRDSTQNGGVRMNVCSGFWPAKGVPCAASAFEPSAEERLGAHKGQRRANFKNVSAFLIQHVLKRCRTQQGFVYCTFI